MMKTLFIDTSYGISGDMTVAAMLNIGMPFEYLENVSPPDNQVDSDGSLDGFSNSYNPTYDSNPISSFDSAQMGNSEERHNKDGCNCIFGSGNKSNFSITLLFLWILVVLRKKYV